MVGGVATAALDEGARATSRRAGLTRTGYKSESIERIGLRAGDPLDPRCDEARVSELRNPLSASRHRPLTKLDPLAPSFRSSRYSAPGTVDRCGND
jgi:hypothetical protein